MLYAISNLSKSFNHTANLFTWSKESHFVITRESLGSKYLYEHEVNLFWGGCVFVLDWKFHGWAAVIVL